MAARKRPRASWRVDLQRTRWDRARSGRRREPDVAARRLSTRAAPRQCGLEHQFLPDNAAARSDILWERSGDRQFLRRRILCNRNHLQSARGGSGTATGRLAGGWTGTADRLGRLLADRDLDRLEQLAAVRNNRSKDAARHKRVPTPRNRSQRQTPVFPGPADELARRNLRPSPVSDSTKRFRYSEPPGLNPPRL